MIDHATLKQLEIFIKIVECGNLSIAAQRLNLTPSSISRSLAKLESQLGVALLKRTTRNIVLTDAGKYLFKRANKILFILNESLINASSFYNHPQGQLKVTCPIAFGVLHLMRVFSEYRAINNDVCLTAELNDQLVNLNEENIDIALRVTATPPENYSIKKICNIKWTYCASREYISLHGTPSSFDDLDMHNCLVNPNVSNTWCFRKKESIHNKINVIIQANSSLALLSAALNHQGIVCLPSYMIGDHIKSNNLIPLEIDSSYIYDEYALYALYHPTKHKDPKIRSFIDFIVSKMERELQ